MRTHAQILTGRINRIDQRFPNDGDEGGFIVARFEADDPPSQVTIQGQVDDLQTIAEGLRLHLVGEWENTKYGPRFVFQGIGLDMTGTDLSGLRKFLEERLTGIGPVRSKALVDRFGHSVLDALREGHEGVAEILPDGLAEAIADKLKSLDHRQLQAIAEVFQILKQVGTRTGIAARLVRRFGSQCPHVLRTNPFEIVLADVGLPFGPADRLWVLQGNDLDHVDRHLALLIQELRNHRNALSATWWTRSTVPTKGTNGQDKAEPIRLLEAVTEGVSRRLLRREDTGPLLALERRARDEEKVAEAIGRLIRFEGRPWPSGRCLQGITDHQRETWDQAASANVAILCGPPGTGKTTVAGSVIAEARRQGRKVIAAAPTGKAAVRLTESIRRVCPDLQARTIHSTLEARPTDHGRWTFGRTENNRLVADLVVIDESSMLACSLAADLFAAIPTGALVLLLGDTGQLASVEHGLVLHDLIAAGVPVGRLSVPMRNAGTDIWEFVDRFPSNRPLAAIEAGIPADATSGTLRLVEAREIADVVERLDNLLDWCELARISADEVQVIAGTNSTCATLNTHLQRRLNPSDDAREEPGVPRVGDRIINLRNRFLPTTPEGTGPSVMVFTANGEQATLEELRPDRTAIVRLATGARVMTRIPATRSKTKDDNKKATFNEWTLSYAITGHKSQGSEWRVVAVFLEDALTLDCNWLYTAVSRSREHAFLIGQRHAISQARRLDRSRDRFTLLQRRLAEHGVHP